MGGADFWSQVQPFIESRCFREPPTIQTGGKGGATSVQPRFYSRVPNSTSFARTDLFTDCLDDWNYLRERFMDRRFESERFRNRSGSFRRF